MFMEDGVQEQPSIYAYLPNDHMKLFQISYPDVCFVKVLTRESSVVGSGSMKSTFLKACFSCGEDPSQVQEGRSTCLFLAFRLLFCFMSQRHHRSCLGLNENWHQCSRRCLA